MLNMAWYVYVQRSDRNKNNYINFRTKTQIKPAFTSDLGYMIVARFTYIESYLFTFRDNAGKWGNLPKLS